MNVHARAVGVKVYTVVADPSPILNDTVPVVSPTVPVKDGVVSEVTLSVLDGECQGSVVRSIRDRTGIQVQRGSTYII